MPRYPHPQSSAGPRQRPCSVDQFRCPDCFPCTSGTLARAIASSDCICPLLKDKYPMSCYPPWWRIVAAQETKIGEVAPWNPSESGGSPHLRRPQACPRGPSMMPRLARNPTSPCARINHGGSFVLSPSLWWRWNARCSSLRSWVAWGMALYPRGWGGRAIRLVTPVGDSYGDLALVRFEFEPTLREERRPDEQGPPATTKHWWVGTNVRVCPASHPAWVCMDEEVGPPEEWVRPSVGAKAKTPPFARGLRRSRRPSGDKTTGRDTLRPIRHRTKTCDEVIPPCGLVQHGGPRVTRPIVTGPAWPLRVTGLICKGILVITVCNPALCEYFGNNLGVWGHMRP
jgi:hypothetical protein